MRAGVVAYLIGAGVVSALVSISAVLIGASDSRGARAAAPSEYDARLKPLLVQYCYDCHGNGEKSGDFSMDQVHCAADLVHAKLQWDKAVQYSRTHIMPPPQADQQPTPDQRDQIVRSIQTILYNIDPAHPDPGRVTIRRLNATEYRNTIRDLIGVSFDPTVDFPQDDTGYGFDNIGDVLSLPPMLLEKYLAAADKILDQAITTDPIEPRERDLPAAKADRSAKIGAPDRDGWIKLTSDDEDALSVAVQVKLQSDYRVKALVYATPEATTQPATTQSTTRSTTGVTTRRGNDEHAKPIVLSLMRDGVVIKDVEVTGSRASPQWIEARVAAPTGARNFSVALRRLRGPVQDKQVSDGHLGVKQQGAAFVKEIILQGPIQGGVKKFTGERLHTASGVERDGDGFTLASDDGDINVSFDAANSGDYLLRAQAFATYVGNEPAKMEMRVDDQPLKVFDVNAPPFFKRLPDQPELAPGAARAVPQIYEVKTALESGEHRLSVRLINDAYQPEAADPNYQDRNLIVQSLEAVDLSAPACPPMPPKMRALFVKYAGKSAAVSNANLPHDPKVARAILADFILRAWRRPPRADEIDRVMKLYEIAKENGESFHASVRHAMKGVLVSSSFLFRGELEPAAPATGATELVGEYELASRLSYFLWSSMPDDELLDLAAHGQLRAKLDLQIKRMLASPKFQEFTDNFAGQWLQFRNLDAVHPDQKLFADYNDRLRDAMQRETELFVGSIMENDRSLFDLISADYTYVNEALAKHYGLKGVQGKDFRKVSLKGTGRRGILTQGSVLTLTSNPTRTSPVKRGKWVMESLLATAPPPPPPNIPPLVEPGKEITGTVRHQLERHREDPACASCHAAMDPIGFALENFDAVGTWRDRDGTGPIDASSAFADGTKFTGASELADILVKTRRNDFLRSVTEHTLTYALGRGVEPFDQPAVDQIIEDLKNNDARFSVLINDVIKSVPFQQRRSNAAVSER